MQVVPMLGGARSAVTSPAPAAPAVLVKEAAPGPYMEGVTMRAGARVAGRTLAVTIARRSSVVGTTREESSSFRICWHAQHLLIALCWSENHSPST